MEANITAPFMQFLDNLKWLNLHFEVDVSFFSCTDEVKTMRVATFVVHLVRHPHLLWYIFSPQLFFLSRKGYCLVYYSSFHGYMKVGTGVPRE